MKTGQNKDNKNLYFARHSFVHDYHRHCEIPHCVTNDGTYLEAQKDSPIPVISKRLIFMIGTRNDFGLWEGGEGA
ncbi:hypothetical protein FACS1894181_06640 [Bacteroidia bacterium]|nr:hypothetical protein FACS1894181_06640 [Bacteroidia bacterium]